MNAYKCNKPAGNAPKCNKPAGKSPKWTRLNVINLGNKPHGMPYTSYGISNSFVLPAPLELALDSNNTPHGKSRTLPLAPQTLCVATLAPLEPEQSRLLLRGLRARRVLLPCWVRQTQSLSTAAKHCRVPKARLGGKVGKYLCTPSCLVGYTKPDHCRQLQYRTESYVGGQVKSISAHPPAVLGACWVRRTWSLSTAAKHCRVPKARLGVKVGKYLCTPSCLVGCLLGAPNLITVDSCKTLQSSKN
jgi:hypothetical protein